MALIYKLIIYSGIAAGIFLTITVILGITGWNYEIHEAMGITTFTFALIHVGLIIYRKYRIKHQVI